MRPTLLLITITSAALLQLGCAMLRSGDGEHPLAKPDMAPCRTNADCRVPAYVSVGPIGECLVQMLVETVTIAAGRQPMVVWRLEKSDPDGDHFDYRFDPDRGVSIRGKNPATDFDDPGYMNGNARKFMWKSRNQRPMRFEYAMLVQRRASPSEPWSDCRLLDPKIVNDGP